MALPSPIYERQLGPSYVVEVTAAASVTTVAIAAADIGADQRIIVTGLRISSSVAANLNFENDSDDAHITEAIQVIAQHPYIAHDPGGIMEGAWGDGIQIANAVATAAEVRITFRIQDRTLAPTYT